MFTKSEMSNLMHRDVNLTLSGFDNHLMIFGRIIDYGFDNNNVVSNITFQSYKRPDLAMENHTMIINPSYIIALEICEEP